MSNLTSNQTNRRARRFSYDELRDSLREHKGFSYSASLGNVIGTANWSVAVSKDSEFVRTREFTTNHYNDYITKHDECWDEDKVLGAWAHKGKFYLDVAQLLPKSEYTLEQALSIARDRDQLAIFDLENVEEISTNQSK